MPDQATFQIMPSVVQLHGSMGPCTLYTISGPCCRGYKVERITKDAFVHWTSPLPLILAKGGSPPVFPGTVSSSGPLLHATQSCCVVHNHGLVLFAVVSHAGPLSRSPVYSIMALRSRRVSYVVANCCLGGRLKFPLTWTHGPRHRSSWP